MNTCIVICGKKVDIGTKVILWNDPDGLNAYGRSKNVYYIEDRKTGKKKKEVVSGARFNSRSKISSQPSLNKIRNIVTQFFLHHSGLYRAKDTFNVLHNQRGISCHFILDDDGTIYQTLDMRERAWHAGLNNTIAVGVEIDSRAYAKSLPKAYDKFHQKRFGVMPRNKRLDRVNGDNILGYEYNDAQYNALINLGIGVKDIFPRLWESPNKYLIDFPRDQNGDIIKSKLSNPTKHIGFICHYNSSSSKRDPIAFDHDRFLRGVFEDNPNQKSTFVDLSDWEKRQKALKKLNFDPGVIDGIFGLNTKKAIIAFQKKYGLVADGVWGYNTQSAIEKALKGNNED